MNPQKGDVVLIMKNIKLATQETLVTSEKQSINFSKWMHQTPD
ncbi:hypothetical protein [Bacillus cereus]|nr:hypothetical protein [Bacillus cereus]